MGFCFSLLVVQSPGVAPWQKLFPLVTVLWNSVCYSSMELSLPVPCSRVSHARSPLCGLCSPAGLCKAAEECRERGSITGFRKASIHFFSSLSSAVRESLALAHRPALGWGQGNAPTTHACQPQPGDRGCGSTTWAREWESALTIHTLSPIQKAGECYHGLCSVVSSRRRWDRALMTPAAWHSGAHSPEIAA